MAETNPSAQVISVFPQKIRIEVEDIEAFRVDDELLTVGSYLRISDHNDCAIISIIENFSIELLQAGLDGVRDRKYIIEALPLGFIDSDGRFIRGGSNIAIPPEGVTPARKVDIQQIYDDIPNHERFCFSKLAQDKDINVPVNGNKLFNKHLAVVGSTGSGKSHTVAKIIQEAIEQRESDFDGLNNSHIVIFDIHAEYKTAFPTASYLDVSSLVLPYWLLSSEELEDLLIESNEEQSHNQIATLKKAVTDEKRSNFRGTDIERDKIHYDSATFFDINEIVAVVKAKNEEMVPGSGSAGVKQGPLYGKLSNFVTRLENKVGDPRLEFLLGTKVKSVTLEGVLRQFLSYTEGERANVTIIDLSGVPFEVLSITVSLISRILFDYGYAYKKHHIKSACETPLVIVYEEAHKYVPRSDLSKFSASRRAIERIAKEGRKYGVTAIIVSQRPSEVSETIFSQCSNFISMRLTNPDDQAYTKRLLPDSLGPLTDSLPILRAGEALLIGDSIVMPSVVLIDRCGPEPSSNDIQYLDKWKKPWLEVDFESLINQWQR